MVISIPLLIGGPVIMRRVRRFDHTSYVSRKPGRHVAAGRSTGRKRPLQPFQSRTGECGPPDGFLAGLTIRIDGRHHTLAGYAGPILEPVDKRQPDGDADPCPPTAHVGVWKTPASGKTSPVKIFLIVLLVVLAGGGIALRMGALRNTWKRRR